MSGRANTRVNILQKHIADNIGTKCDIMECVLSAAQDGEVKQLTTEMFSLNFKVYSITFNKFGPLVIIMIYLTSVWFSNQTSCDTEHRQDREPAF